MEYEEKELYLFLNFDDVLDRDYFNKKKIYFKVSNLDQEYPFVQLDDNVFVGTYRDCIGTNVFFKQIDDPPEKPNVFEKETPISLQYVTKQIKELKLKHAVRKKKTEKENDIDAKLESCTEKENSETTAEQEQGEEVSVTESEEVDVDKIGTEHVERKASEKPNINQNITNHLQTVDDINKKKISELTIDAEKYHRLKLLARTPLKFNVPVEKVEIPNNLLINYFHRWLSSLFTQIPTEFPEVNTETNNDSLEDSIDVRTSIENGIISNHWPRMLTENERSALKDVENYKNMSLPMRHLVVSEIIEGLKSGKERPRYGLTVEQYTEVLKCVQFDIVERISLLKNKAVLK